MNQNLNDEVLRQERVRYTVLEKVKNHQALSDDDIRVVCLLRLRKLCLVKKLEI